MAIQGTNRTIPPQVTRRKFLHHAAIVSTALTFAGTIPTRVFAANHQGIKLGHLAPFTGSLAEFGPFWQDAVTLAVEQLNTAAEEVYGGKLISEYLPEDTRSLPTPGIEAARKLVEAQGVPAIVGAGSSGVTVATATSVTIPAEVLQISNASTSPLISVLPEDEGKDFLFRTTSSDAMQGVVAAELAAGEIIDGYQVKTASTIFVNNPYGQGLSNAFSRSFQMRGGTVHAQIPHPEEVQPTYNSQLAAALKDDPDLLLVVSYEGHTATLLKESRDVFGFTNWQFVDGNRSVKVLEAVGGEDIADSYGTAPGQDPSIPAFQNFEAAFKEKFDRDRIMPFTDSAYDAAIVIGLATAKAVTDGVEEITGTVLRDRLREVANPEGEEIVGGSQEEITKALRLIEEGQDINYAGTAGSADFDDNGDVRTPVAVWKYTSEGTETVQVRSAEDIPAE